MSANPPQPYIRSERTILRMGKIDDITAIINYLDENELHLLRSGPARVPGYLTPRYWRQQLAMNETDYQSDKALKMFLFASDDREVIGSVNFNAILRGAAHFCYLGYGLSREHPGKGFMFEALTGAIEFAFADLNLHRIMANYMPTNRRSGDLLKRLGFIEEGFAKNYLFLNGRWCDHVMTSLTNKNWQKQS